MTITSIRTPIVYYGGSSSLLPHILPMIPVHDNYTEVFFGGGAVFFSKPMVKNETINDKLDVVINFYQTLKCHFFQLKKLIDSTLISRTIHKEAVNTIYLHKLSNNELLSDLHYRVKLAWAFWVCTNFAYSNKIGGGYKYSNNMSVSVPDTLKTKKSEFTEILVNRIEHAYIENSDAVKVLSSRNSKGAFHYIDPPYPNADQGHYKGYTWEEYNDLLSFLANEIKGKFMLASYKSDMLDQFVLDNNWFVHDVSFRRTARTKAGPVRSVLLVRNYNNSCNTIPLFK